MELSEYVSLPDVDFIVCTDDYSVVEGNYPAPVLCFCRCGCEKNIILIPDHQILDLVKNQNVLTKIQEGRTAFKWQNKISKAIWRGGNSGGITAYNFDNSVRVKAVDISKKFPELLDAKINLLYAFNEPYIDEMLEAGGYLGETLSIPQQMKYKYQLLLDGNCASWPGAYWRLHSNCAVLKQVSQQRQWYYSLLQPFINYIPIANDLEDLIEKIEWAKNNDDKVQDIVKNANELAAEALTYADMLYYIYIVIITYAKLQSSDAC